MKKMMLVPQQGLPSPLLQKLGRLDEEMKNILDRTDVDEKTKAHEYSQVLGRYLDTKARYQQPRAIPIIDHSSREQPNKTVNLDSVPSVYRKKADSLLRHIGGSAEIDWNERNELVVDGAPISGSNIIDLVDDLARPITKQDPRGIGQFVDALRRSNVPQSFIANKRRLGPPVLTAQEFPFTSSPRKRRYGSRTTTSAKYRKLADSPPPPSPPLVRKGRGKKWKKW